MARYPRPRDLQVSPEELAATRTAGSAAGQGQAIGGGIGTALGAGLGALGYLIPGAGVVIGDVTTPLGASLGGSAGGLVGGDIGGGIADAATAKARKLAEVRQRIIARSQLRQQALAALEAL